MLMKQDLKENYVSPETEVISVRTESAILTMSGGEYPEWQEEDV